MAPSAAPAPEQQRALRAFAPAAAALAALLALAYALTMPPDITFEDVPLFAAVCYTRGVAHPPGFPLHTLLCWPLAQLADVLPLSIAQASALASALPAIGACIAVAWLTGRAAGSWPAGILAGGLLGLTPGFWQQAIIPEAYALNALLIALAWLAADSYAREPTRPRLVALALLCALGLANHWPLFVIPAPALLLWLMPARSSLLRAAADPRTIAWLAGACAIGLLPYLHLLAPAEGSFRFIPVEDDGLWWYASRQLYSVDGANLELAERIAGAGTATGRMLADYGYAGVLLGLIGLAAMLRRGLRLQAAAVAWAALSCTALLFLLRPHALHDELAQSVFSVYPLPAYLWLALPVAFGAGALAQRLRLRLLGQWAACIAVLAATAYVRLPDADRSSDDLALRYAQLTRELLPADAQLIIPISDLMYPHGYLQAVADSSEEIKITDEHKFFGALDVGYKLSDEQERKLANAPGAVFFSGYQLSNTGRTYNGLFLVPGGAPAGKLSIALTQDVRDFSLSIIAQLRSGMLANAWSRRFAREQVAEIAKQLSTAHDIDGLALDVADSELLAQALTLPAGRAGRFFALASSGRMAPAQVFNEAAELERDFPSLQPALRSRILHLRAVALLIDGDAAGAVHDLERALREHPSDDNYTVLIDLLQAYALQERYSEYRRVRMRFPKLVAGEALVEADASCAAALDAPCAPDVKESLP